MAGLAGSQFNHPDLQPTRKLRDKTAVQSLVNLMDASWINPFRVDQDTLVHLATAAVAPADVVHDLMNTQKIGEDVYQTFKSDRIEKAAEDPGKIDFFATMKNQRLKTFTDTYTKKVKCKAKVLVLKMDRKLFGHIVFIAQTRKLDMKQVLSHPPGPIPWALAEGDGSLRKTD